MSWNTKLREVLPMIRKDEGPNVLVTEGVRLEGNLAFNDSGHFQAHLKGNIKSKHHIVLDKCAKVDGDIKAASCEILGQCNGKLEASTDICIVDGAKVKGVCKASSIKVKKGAKLDVIFDIKPSNSVAKWVKQTAAGGRKK